MLPGVEQGVDVWSDGSGMPPSKVADHLFDAAIESGDFCERAVTPSRVCARVCSLADAPSFADVYVDNVEDPDFCVRTAIKRMSRMLEAETPEGLSGSRFMEEHLAPRLAEWEAGKLEVL